jgi:hypothetical protein
MNNEYRERKLSGYTEKTNDGKYGKTIFFGCVALIIGILIWLVSNYVTQTAETKDSSLPRQTQAVELSETTPTLAKPNSNPALLNGQIKEQLVAVIKQPTFLNQLSTPYGFARDPIHHRLIWTSGANETFMSAKLDGSEVTTIQSNFEDPYLIRIETPYGHKMLFYADGSLRLREIDSQMNTSSETVLLRLQEQQLHGLGFDDDVNTVYIGDQFGQPSLAILIPTDDQPVVAISMTLLNPK